MIDKLFESIRAESRRSLSLKPLPNEFVVEGIKMTFIDFWVKWEDKSDNGTT